MGCFNWTIDKLRERYNYLLSLYAKREALSEQEKIQLSEDLSLLRALLEMQGYNYKYQGLGDKYYEMTSQLQGASFLWDEIREFAMSSDSDMSTLPIKPYSLSRKDLLDLTHDFFKNNFDRFFFDNFMKSFYRRRDHIVFEPADQSGLYGETFSIKTTKESFLKIYRQFTLEDLLSTIHEYMHATSFLINSDHFQIGKDLYAEIDPLFTELLACDYFKDIFGYHKMDVLKVAIHAKYSKSAQNATSLMGVIDHEETIEPFQGNRDLRRCARNHGIADLDDALDSFAVIPLIDYMFAIEFYSLYKKDKDRALQALKVFITTNCESEQDYLTTLKKYGIYLNKSARSYSQDCLMLSRKLKSHR